MQNHLLLFAFLMIAPNVLHCSDDYLSNLISATTGTLVKLKEELRLFRNVFLCLEISMVDDQDIIQQLDSVGIPYQLYSDDLWSNSSSLHGLNYKMESTQIYIGTTTWLRKKLMECYQQVDDLMLNIFITRIILVAIETSPTMIGSIPLDKFREGLLVILIQQEDSGNPIQDNIIIHRTHFPNSGQISVERIGGWNSLRGLNIFEPIYKVPSTYGNRKLIVTVLHKPLVFDVKDENGEEYKTYQEMTGYAKDLIDIVKEKLHLSVDAIKTNSFGSLQDGKWTGTIGILVSKDADLAPMDFTPSYGREQVADSSELLGYDPVIMISQGPRPLLPPFLLLSVFQSFVWITLGLVILACGFIMVKFERSLSSSLSVMAAMVSLYKTFLNQNNTFPIKKSSAMVFASIVSLVSVVIFSLYKGSITSFLTVSRRTIPIDSGEDLLEKLSTVTPIARLNTYYYSVVKNFETYKPIGDKLELAGAGAFTWDFFSAINEGKYVLIDTYTSGVGRKNQFEDKTAECKFHVSKESLSNDMDVMFHRRNSIFQPQIDRVLRYLRESGIILHIRNDYFKESCQPLPKRLSLKPFTIEQFQSAFYILAIGLMLALLTFSIEMCFSAIKQKSTLIQKITEKGDEPRNN